MRIVILTSIRFGNPSGLIPILAEAPGIDIAMIVLSREERVDRFKWLKQKARKIRRIGMLGGLTGIYLRGWNRASAAEDLLTVAERLGIPLGTTPSFRVERARELIRRSGAELGITMGTPIIPRRVFEIPQLGMINVHGDVLPRFRGGTSVIWPIHEGVQEAGFTIHRIDAGIDTGPVLHTERFPLELRPTLKETYQVNVAEIQRRVPDALVRVLTHYAEFLAAARPQTGAGMTFTTPTLRQFLTMRRQHRRMWNAARASAGR